MKSLLILAMLFSAIVSAAQVKLAWDANPEPDVVSYRISYGQTPDALNQARVVEGTTLTLDLEPGAWFFAAQATNAGGLSSPPSPTIAHTVQPPSPWGWIVKHVSDEQTDGYGAELAIDGDANTFWHTSWREGQPQKPGPHEIQIDMGAVKLLSGFTYLPRQDEYSGSNVRAYDFHLSLDGTSWGEPVASGEIAQGKQLTTITFLPRSARYFRLIAKSNHDGTQSASIAELNVIEATAPAPPATPKGLRVVEIQTSSNLADWKTIAMIPQDPGNTPAEFVRARLSTIPAPTN